MLILRHGEVRGVLLGREQAVLDAVRTAYLLHDSGRSVLPHSVFLRFPRSDTGTGPARRIIGLPGYLDGEVATAGLKWIASFPGNLERGLDRASAVIVLNSLETGRPEVLIEASLISAARTAASAAVAADLLAAESADGVSIIGCGAINLAVLRFLREVRPKLREVTLFDLHPGRARDFADRCASALPGVTATVAGDHARAMAAHRLVSVATTAAAPYLDLSGAGCTVLHLSLRDLVPEAIVASRNVVDDADHVCREQTSLHLTEQRVGDRRFIDATLGQLLRSGVGVRRRPAGVRRGAAPWVGDPG
jgi:ornithine cyclodeaminase